MRAPTLMLLLVACDPGVEIRKQECVDTALPTPNTLTGTGTGAPSTGTGTGGNGSGSTGTGTGATGTGTGATGTGTGATGTGTGAIGTGTGSVVTGTGTGSTGTGTGATGTGTGATGTGTGATGTGTGVPSLAALRIMNGSPGHPGVDLYLDGDVSPIAPDVNFGMGTPTRMMQAMVHRFVFTPTADPYTVLWEDDIDLQTDHSVVVHQGLGGELEVLELVGNTLGLAPGNARIRFTHLAVDVPGEVSLYDAGQGGQILDGVPFGTAREVDYVAGVTQFGIDIDDVLPLRWRFEDLDVPAGQLVDVHMLSRDNGTSPFLVMHLADGSNPQARVR